jgi:hypothetical protein
MDFPGYTYRVLITSVPYAAEVVTRMYVGRADSENRIKELKEDLTLDTFYLKSFDGTDAALSHGLHALQPISGFSRNHVAQGMV